MKKSANVLKALRTDEIVSAEAVPSRQEMAFVQNPSGMWASVERVWAFRRYSAASQLNAMLGCSVAKLNQSLSAAAITTIADSQAKPNPFAELDTAVWARIEDVDEAEITAGFDTFSYLCARARIFLSIVFTASC